MKIPLMRSTKLRALRISSEMIKHLALHGPGMHLCQCLKTTPLTAGALKLMCGYRRTFSSFAEASACAAAFLDAGHEHECNASMHLDLARSPRPSDYAALFHLAECRHEINTVFDLGGNVGNLFYCYNQALSFPGRLRWTVQDVPAMVEIGKALAAERGEDRLRFTDSFSAASGADLLLASGSMHYFETPLPELIATLPQRPRHVIINRTPLIDSDEAFTVQDAGSFLVTCKLFNKEKLIRRFVETGYRLINSWQCPELSLHIPADQEHSVPSYSGLYLRLAEQEQRIPMA